MWEVQLELAPFQEGLVLSSQPLTEHTPDIWGASASLNLPCHPKPLSSFINANTFVVQCSGSQTIASGSPGGSTTPDSAGLGLGPRICICNMMVMLLWTTLWGPQDQWNLPCFCLEKERNVVHLHLPWLLDFAIWSTWPLESAQSLFFFFFNIFIGV